MKNFIVMWKDTREVSITIIAENKAEALRKWKDTDIEVNDQDVVCEHGEFVQIEEDI